MDIPSVVSNLDIFNKHATTGDGVLTSLKIMEVMLEKKVKVSELLRELKIYPQLLINVPVVDKTLAKNDKDVIKAAEAVEKELGDDGRILVRESGTESVVRVMVEAGTNEVCQRYADEVVTVLRQKGHIRA